MPDEDQIRHKVRRVVYRTLGVPHSSRPGAVRSLVTEADVQAVPVGGQLSVPQGALVTPLARQVAMERHVSLVEKGAVPAPSLAAVSRTAAAKQAVAVGADHEGARRAGELVLRPGHGL